MPAERDELTDAQSGVPQATQQLAVTSETRDKARKRLRRKLAGDLDVIILKALRKEPVRRYASVEQFSEDLRRYLEGRPVVARRDTFLYRTTKFLRRNAAVVTVVAAAILLLLSSTSTSQEASRVSPASSWPGVVPTSYQTVPESDAEA